MLLRDDSPFPRRRPCDRIKMCPRVPPARDERVLHAFAAWRGQVRQWSTLALPDGAAPPDCARKPPPEPIDVAEITASAFALLAPRASTDGTFSPRRTGSGGTVIVLGYDAWLRRFSADPAIVGRPFHSGGVQTTIVGIMPPGFAFPIRHQFWIPSAQSVEVGPWVRTPRWTFGRLRTEYNLEHAQGALTSVGRQVAESCTRTWPAPFSRSSFRSPRRTAISTDRSSWFLMRAAQFLVWRAVFLVRSTGQCCSTRTITRLGELASAPRSERSAAASSRSCSSKRSCSRSPARAAAGL